MSKKSSPHVEAAPPPSHADELIVVPKGTSRWRFLLTFAVVLFLLVIFVVADMFQVVVGGAGARGNPTVVTWHDPVEGEDHSRDAAEFSEASLMLNRLADMGFYRPESVLYAAAEERRRSRSATDEDVASFLVYEDLAVDAGIAVSQPELVDLLRASFGTGKQLVAVAKQYRMPAKQLEEDIRRLYRVDKLKELLRSGLRLADPAEMLERWQGEHTQHRFQYAEILSAPFIEAAQAEVPADEALLAWWHEKPLLEQQQLFTEEKTVPQVAWIDLTSAFDESALLAAFPPAEGTDEEKLASEYYERNKATRFRNTEAADPGRDAEAQDVDAEDAAAQDAGKPEPKLYQDFADVRETALREARIESALAALIADIEEREKAGESVDLALEAGKYGLQTYTSPEGMTRQQLTTAEGWGNQNLGQRLAFGVAGQLLKSVVVDGQRMFVARVLERLPREEPPFETIRDSVAKQWVNARAAELALARANELVATLSPAPEELPEGETHAPTATEEEFTKTFTEAGYPVQVREWRERFELPPGETVATLSDGERFLRNEASDVYDLEAGRIAPPRIAQSNDRVYVVRVDGHRPKPAEELTTKDLASLPQMVRQESLRELGAKVFDGRSDWFKERFRVRFPEREARANS